MSTVICLSLTMVGDQTSTSCNLFAVSLNSVIVHTHIKSFAFLRRRVRFCGPFFALTITDNWRKTFVGKILELIKFYDFATESISSSLTSSS